jgi:hypothetical protein
MAEDTQPGHRILEILYEDHFGDNDSNLQTADIADKIDGIDKSQVSQILGNLDNAGFVNKSGTPKLTHDGLRSVLNQKEREEQAAHRDREHRTNNSIKYLTIALVLVGGLRAVAVNLQMFSDSKRLLISAGGAALIVIAMLVMLRFQVNQ